MISFSDFSFWYAGSPHPALEEVNLQIAEGEFALVAGSTGSGKSTLLKAVNGLVPRFTGGHAEGRVVASGRDTRRSSPRDFAESVGVVLQDPVAGFVTDVVEDEIAYGMEQLAVAADVMRRRVEEILDLMGISSLRRRALRTLSGGEQQRVALGAVLAAGPRILVLDEPTSALDPAAAEDALAAIVRLVHDLGVTVLAAEHRLERVIEYADRLVVVEGGRVRHGRPADLIAVAPVVPPVVELGRWAGWDPLALSVRDARRVAAPLRARLAAVAPPRSRRQPAGPVEDGLVAKGVTVVYGEHVAVHDVSMDCAPGEVVALMGRNGSGKTSLLWALHGAGSRDRGIVRVAGADPRELSAADRARSIVLVPHQATDLLFHDSVAAECAASDDAEPGSRRARHRPFGRAAADGIWVSPRDTTASTWRLFAELAAVDPDDAELPRRHPRDLSDGQRLALVLAIQLRWRPRALLLDEPTRGLDYAAKSRLQAVLTSLAEAGHAIVVATHDVEFVAGLADRVVVLANGDVVTSAPTGDAIAASPVFAPQVAKVLAPLPWLTVDQLRSACD